MPSLVCALGPDSAGSELTELVLSARHRIDAAFHEVSLYFAWSFATAAEKGVAVRLLLDAHPGANSGTVARLRGSAVDVREIGGRQGSDAHWKLLRVDSDRVAVGSGNLVRRDAPRNPVPPRHHGAVHPGTREWWLLVDGAPRIASEVSAAIDTAWREPARAVAEVVPATTAPPVGVPHPLMAPLRIDVPETSLRLSTGGDAVRAMQSELVEAATVRVLCTVPYVHTSTAEARALLDALDAAVTRRAVVRLLLGTAPAAHDAAHLHERSFASRVMDPLRSTTGHAKGVVADDRVMVSSANWSAAGLSSNLEAALAVDALAAAGYFAAAHERDWAVAEPLAPGRQGPR
jgi:phosphatidylserine/phosphatidylglycerophosphate/cardiolipin synthase-like enzyme